MGGKIIVSQWINLHCQPKILSQFPVLEKVALDTVLLSRLANFRRSVHSPWYHLINTLP